MAVDVWQIGTAIYGALFFGWLLIWILLRFMLRYSTTLSSVCEVSCFGAYAWSVIVVFTLLQVLDATMQSVMGLPLLLGWVVAQISTGRSYAYCIRHEQLPPTYLDLLPGGILIGLVFWQMAFYIFPYLPGVLPLKGLSLPMYLPFVAAAWGGQCFFLYLAFKLLKPPNGQRPKE